MPTLTTNFSLNKPLVNDATDQDLWGGYLNDDLDTIDAQLKICRDSIHRSVTGTDSVVIGDRNKTILCDATSGAFTETLIAAATAGDGFVVSIVKTDATAFAVTVDGNGSETIGGALTFALSGQGDAVTLVCDGSNWHFKGNKTTPSAVGAASTSAAGIIQIATDAEVATGTNATKAVTPSSLKNKLGISSYYESAEQTVVPGTSITLTHSLGAIPKLVQIDLVCKITEGGWSVGDRIAAQQSIWGYNAAASHPNDRGAQVVYNATQIKGVFGRESWLILTTAGVAQDLTPANWRMVVRAWA